MDHNVTVALIAANCLVAFSFVRQIMNEDRDEAVVIALLGTWLIITLTIGGAFNA